MTNTYLEQVKADIKTYLEENESRFSLEELAGEDPEEVAEELNNILWTEDSVTGNASGSYTCNREEAKQYVLNDMDTVMTALEEFCVDAETLGNKFLNEDWEYLDVTARCYVLGEALDEILKEVFGPSHEDEPWLNAPFYGENPYFDCQ